MQNSSKMKGEITDPSNVIKQNISMRSSRKFMGSTLTQNFFTSSFDDDFYLPPEPVSFKINKKEEETPSSRRKSRRKLEQSVLQPMKQKEKMEIYSHSTVLNNLDDIDEIIITSPQKKQEEDIFMKSEIIGRSSRRKTHHKVTKQPSQKQQEAPNVNKQIENGHVHIDLGDTTSQLLFDESDEAHKKQVQPKKANQNKAPAKTELKPQELPFSFPKMNFSHEFNEENDEEEPKSVIPAPLPLSQYLQKTNKVVSNVTGSQYFDFSNEEDLRQKLFREVTKNTTLRMEVIRDNGGFNTFWPEFHLHFTADGKRVLSAKKTSSRPTTTFIFSRDSHMIDEASNSYLGKAKSTALGDTFNIFAPGLSPNNAKERNVPPRELIASLTYSTSLFHTNGPRKFSLYMMRPEFRYYKDFQKQVHMYEEEIPLSTLYASHKDKIRLVNNRRPLWVESIGGYQLNFRGMAPCPSVKNFILEDENGQEMVLFGKKGDHSFNLEVSEGIAPYLAFVVAITTFDNRLIFQ